MAHSSLELSIGGKNYKYKAITERLNFFARALFEDVIAEGDRWVKKEDFVSELFFLFINLYADSTLFGGASSWIKVKNDSSKTYLKFRMDVLRKPAIKTLDIFKYDFQFRRTFFSPMPHSRELWAW